MWDTNEVVYNCVVAAAAPRWLTPCYFSLVFNQASLNSRLVAAPVIRYGSA
jgi:hypothetical protein